MTRLRPGALIDAGTGALLTSTNFTSVLFTLNEFIPGTVYAHDIQYAQKASVRDIVNGDRNRYPEWRWNPGAGEFTPMQPGILTDEIRERSKLAEAKREAIEIIIERVSPMRVTQSSAMHGQDLVHHMKATEASLFKTSGYDERRLVEFPFVRQYADIAGISPRAAADEILFQAQLRTEELVRSEGVRMRFLARVREAQTPADLADFRKDIDAVTFSVLK